MTTWLILAVYPGSLLALLILGRGFGWLWRERRLLRLHVWR